MNPKVEALLHKYVHQEWTRGVPSGKGEAKRGPDIMASYLGPVLWYWDTPIAYMMADPASKENKVLLWRSFRRVAREVEFDGVTTSRTTAEVLRELVRAVPGGVTLIEVPTWLPGVAARKTYGCRTASCCLSELKGIAERSVEFTQTLIDSGEYKTIDDAEYAFRIINSMRKMSMITPDIVPADMVTSWGKTVDAAFAGKAANGKICKTFRDYTRNLEAERQYLAGAKQDVRVAESRCRIAERHSSDAADDAVWQVLRDGVAAILLDMNVSKKEASNVLGNIANYFPALPYRREYSLRQVLSEHAASALHWVNVQDTLHIFGEGSDRYLTTSRQVTLRDSAFTAACKLAKVAAAGVNIEGKHIGSFRVEKQTDNYIKVGCHAFSMDHVQFFAEHCHLGEAEYKNAYSKIVGDTAPPCVVKIREFLDKLDENLGEALQTILKERECTPEDIERLHKELDEAKETLAEAKAEITAANRAARASLKQQPKTKHKKDGN